MIIDNEYFKNYTVNRNIICDNTDNNESIISCGFLNKKTESCSNIDLTIKYYGGVYVLNGTGVHIDSKGKEYKIHPGCFIQRLPGEIHSTYIDPASNWLEFYFCFGQQVFKSMSNLGIFNDKEQVLYPGLSNIVFNDLLCIMERLNSCNNNEMPFILFDIQKILYNISLMCKAGKNDDKAHIALACEMIKKNYNVGMKVEQIASKLDIGYESFRKNFNKIVGMSPAKYIINERINAAKTRLLNENVSIKMMALDLGYSDVFAFAKQFKNYTGMTPSEFIKKH
ncbi:MAG: helix-turn-helix domain-containing protein [Saccharofermentanales bacterium]